MNVIIPCQPDRNGIEICLHESNVNYSGVKHRTLISSSNWFKIIELVEKVDNSYEIRTIYDLMMHWYYFYSKHRCFFEWFYWNDAI